MEIVILLTVMDRVLWSMVGNTTPNSERFGLKSRPDDRLL